MYQGKCSLCEVQGVLCPATKAYVASTSTTSWYFNLVCTDRKACEGRVNLKGLEGPEV
jgi:hypothetical protein